MRNKKSLIKTASAVLAAIIAALSMTSAIYAEPTNTSDVPQAENLTPALYADGNPIEIQRRL